MSSDQLPPPLANLSFPPDKTELQINYLDSFVTSWVTPESSQDPCFFSMSYWNDSSNGPWINKLNETVSLNGTKLVSLAFIDSDGIGVPELNYVDPLGRYKHVRGTGFHINHDPGPSKAMTWNQDALTSSTTTPASTPALSLSIPSAYTTTTPPPSTHPSPSAADGLTSSSTSTASQSSGRASSSSHGAEYASIALGTTLAVVLTAALIIFCIRSKRHNKPAEQAVQLFSATPSFVQNKPHGPHEKDGEVVSNELGDESGRWEMDTDRRGGLSARV